MDFLRLSAIGFCLISLGHCCTDDHLWDLITCGPQTVEYISRVEANGDYNFCGTGTLQAGKVNRDILRATFFYCQKGFKLSTCSAMQQKELPATLVENSYNAIPCDVVNDPSPPPQCASGFIKCINNAAASVVKLGTKGSACVCAEKSAVKTALTECVKASPLDSCASLSSPHKTALTASKNKLDNILNSFDCSGVDEAECDCYNSIQFCIEDPAHGDMDNFLKYPWSLVESYAVEDQTDTKAVAAETSRAWTRYQQCRTLGYPDQLDRTMKCIQNNSIVNSEKCGINFPETLAFAEHEANTTFYQTIAAAAKNMQDFCHVWCRNTSHWTKEMLTCLSGFHPPNHNQQASENIITYINNNNNNDAIKKICDDDPALVDKDLECASNKIKDCPYLPYHILIADRYSFQHTLTTSDAMEALYKVLRLCGKNATDWALKTIARRDADKIIDGTESDAFNGFFSASPRTALFVESPLMLICAVSVILMAIAA